MYDLFYSAQNLKSINFENFDTSKVTRMNGMFYQCSSLISLNLSSFDTSSVIFMYALFKKNFS